jgi:cell wall-associated NlpC family hydrolase
MLPCKQAHSFCCSICMRYALIGSAVVIVILSLLVFFKKTAKEPERKIVVVDTPAIAPHVPDSIAADHPDAFPVETGTTTPSELLEFARTLKGIPYQYACADPEKGFDCSGFITYVFDHFHINVPRSSVDFTNVGKEVPVSDAKPGDLILFTGTNNTIRKVGHIGIVNAVKDTTLEFIHSSSGKEYSVIITPLDEYYKGRFMKIVRVFPQNEAM